MDDSAEQSHSTPTGGRRRARTPRGLRIALVASLVGLGVVGPLSALAAVGTSALSPAPALAGGPLVNGGGSSYAAVAIDQWDAQVQTLYGDTINYNTTSSVLGLNQFAENEIDFGASEIGYSTGQAAASPTVPYQYLPDVAGATCLMYNLTGETGKPITQLLLNSSIMANIFSGQIKYWDDPAIKALNPGALLPKTPISVVWRSDASGDNYLFTEYLTFEQPSIWNAFSTAMGYPAGADAVYPYPTQGNYPKKYNLTGWIGAQGSDIASNDVAASNGAITYVETAYAYLHDKPCAYVENASGHYVIPTELDDAVALEGARLLPDLEQKLDGVYTNRLPDTYPISAYSYLVTQEATESPQKGAVLGQFIQFIACQGQQAAGQLGYSPLPPNLVQDDFDAVDRINGAAKAPASPTASNCKNPYVDGQTPLPGEPVVQGQQPPPNNGGGTTTTTTPGSNSTGSQSTGSKSGSKGHGGKNGKGTKGTGSNPGSSKGNPGGVLSGPGKTQSTFVPGLKLLGAINSLEGQSGPSASTLWLGLLGAVVILGAPAMLLAGRRRTRRKLVPARVQRSWRPQRSWRRR
jgi:phosphate ABC transporter phosphate-binding protein